MNRILRYAQLAQGDLRFIHHRRRAADKGVLEAAEVQQMGGQFAQLVAVDAPLQQIAVHRLLAEQVYHLQTLRIAVFQIGQRLTEHHAVAAAVAVNQREAAVDFGGEGGVDNRHHRRNAGAGGNRQVVSATPGLRLVAEMSLRHHHVQRHALLNVALGIAREAPAVDGFDRDANFTWRAAVTNGVTAAQFFAAQTGF